MLTALFIHFPSRSACTRAVEQAMEAMRDCVIVTRGIRKRAATNSFVKQQPDAKKRMVLGEISDFEIEFRGQTEKNVKGKIRRITSEVDIDAKYDDPQMCPAYVSDIFAYLRDMELSRRGGTLVAIRTKYKQHKFKAVSELTPLPEINDDYLDLVLANQLFKAVITRRANNG